MYIPFLISTCFSSISIILYVHSLSILRYKFVFCFVEEVGPNFSKSTAFGAVNDIQKRSNKDDNAYMTDDKTFSCQMKNNTKLNASLSVVQKSKFNYFEKIEKPKIIFREAKQENSKQDIRGDQKRQLHDLFMNCTLKAKLKNDFQKVSYKKNHLLSEKNPIFLCTQGKKKKCAENAIRKLRFGKVARDFKVYKLKPISPWKEDKNDEDENSAMDTAFYVTCALVLFAILAINLLYLFLQVVKTGNSRFKFQNLTLKTTWSKTLLMALGLLMSHAPVGSDVRVSTTQGTFFQNDASGRYLQGYIYESSVVYDLIICQMRCNRLHSICKSLNYIENEDGSHICEINYEAEYCTLPGKFIVRENSFYVETVPETDDAGLCSAFGHRGVIKKTKEKPACSAYSIWFHRRSIADYAISHGSPEMTAITACFWVKINQKEGWIHFISYAATHDLANEFIVAEETELYFQIQDKPGKTILITTQTTTKDGSWHAICCSWSSHNGLYRVYKDGKIQHNVTEYQRGHKIPGGGIWILGQDQDNLGGGFEADQMMQGEITEVNIWDKVLSYDEIQEFSLSCESNLQGNVKSWKDFLAGVKGNARYMERPACCKV